MRPVDAFVNSVRRAIEHFLPWYDVQEVDQRTAERQRIRSETERVHRRSISARLRAEEIAAPYKPGDKAIRR